MLRFKGFEFQTELEGVSESWRDFNGHPAEKTTTMASIQS